MNMFALEIGSLQADLQLGTTLTLPTADGQAELHVRVCPTDAQLLAMVLAGVATPATRLAQLVRRLATQLDAAPTHLLLERNERNVVEASLVLVKGLETVAVPVTFGDAIVLARVQGLPLAGDGSLAPLMRRRQAHAEVEPQLPAAFAAFFDELDAA